MKRLAPTVISYRATTTGGVLQSVDFSSVAGKNYAFFQCYDEAGLKKIEPLMTSPPLNQELVAVTQVHGKPLLITRNHASPFTILDALKEQGEQFEQASEPKHFDAWKVRSYLGFAGQSLQLASSFMRPKFKIDTSMFVFAASNLAANAINLVYHQGQEVDDVHQLRYLKQRVNRELAPHLKSGEQVISIDSNRLAQRPAEESHKPLDNAKTFLRHHSVAIGELGLRYFGAMGLAFPARYWKDAWTGHHTPQLDSSKFRRYAGLSSVLGKTVALTSHIPDPYNPKPPTLLDTLREKFSFISGGLIEITSFSALAYGCFFDTKKNGYEHGVKFRGKLYPDFIGGIGASLFVMGYVVRTFAKFGERKVNMGELYAHASDMLAETPPEKVSQLLANTAASLTEHFEQEKPMKFAQIYTNLINDLGEYHAASVTAADALLPATRPKSSAQVLALPKMPTTRVEQAELAEKSVKIAAISR